MEASIDQFRARYAALGWQLDPSIRTAPAIRVNTLLVSIGVLMERLAERGVVLEKIPFAQDGFWIRKSTFSLGSTSEYLRGLYYMQDAAAQIPVQILDPKPGELVLDCCAAPGGKTTQLAQWMKNKGVIVACENSVHRMTSLKANVERCGTENVMIYAADAADVGEFGMRFDKVLLDAPCAGNFASDASWFSKRTVEDAKRNTATQRKLFQAAIGVLRQGGTLVYSTCSLEPEENEFIIEWALKNLPVKCVETGVKYGVEGVTYVLDQQLSEQVRFTRRVWPQNGQNEGFFVAKLVKHG